MEAAGRSNWTNVTFNESDSIKHTYRLGVRLLAGSDIANAVLGTCLNALLLVTILGSRDLRRDVRNLLIANLAGADLLVSALLDPLSAAEALGGAAYGCQAHQALQMLGLFCGHFLGAWGVVCLDCLLLARLCRLDMPLSSFLTSAMTTSISVWKRRLDRSVLVLVLALPWLLSVLVITPIVFSGMHRLTEQFWSDERCPFVLVRWAMLALQLLFFFIPCFVACLLLAVSACLLVYRRRQGSGVHSITPSMPPAVTTLSTASATAAANQDRPSAYVVASALTFLLTGPHHLRSIVLFYEGVHRDLEQWLVVSFALIWLAGCKSVFLPVVWFALLPDIRARAYGLVHSAKAWLFRQKEMRGFDPSVSYKNMSS